MSTSSAPVRLPAKAETPLLTLTREVVVNEKGANSLVWIIEMHNGADNRLTHDLIDRAFKPALDIVEREWREVWRAAQARAAAATKVAKLKAKDGSESGIESGSTSTSGAEAAEEDGSAALIIVGRRSQDKFFSNGLDFVNAIKDPNFFAVTLNPFLARVLTFPIPVVAAINGHTFAAGFMLALCCDYRVMTDGSPRRAWACMNEVHFGATWPVSFTSIANAKIPSPQTLRAVALEGKRFTPQEALELGLVDEVARSEGGAGGNADAVLNAARGLAARVADGARTGVWGMIKKDLYQHTLEDISKDYRISMPALEDAAAKARL